jgi:hypothetical protein
VRVLVEREFRSVLAMSVPWATREPDRAKKLIGVLDQALSIAASNRTYWDTEVGRISGWGPDTVREVAGQNLLLRGTPGLTGGAPPALPSPNVARWALTADDRADIARLVTFAHDGLSVQEIVGEELLDGKVPQPRSGAGPAPGKGPPPKGPPGKGPPPMGPAPMGPGKGPPPMGPAPMGPPNKGGPPNKAGAPAVPASNAGAPAAPPRPGQQ